MREAQERLPFSIHKSLWATASYCGIIRVMGSTTSPFVQIPQKEVFIALFCLVAVIWILYTLVAAFHWFKYGNRNHAAIMVMALHLGVTIALLIFILSGFYLL